MFDEASAHTRQPSPFDKPAAAGAFVPTPAVPASSAADSNVPAGARKDLPAEVRPVASAAATVMSQYAEGAGGAAPTSGAASDAGSLARTNGLYADPNSQAANWTRNNPGDARAAPIRDSIASQATGKWFGGWCGDVKAEVHQYVAAAAKSGKVPVIVAYNIPKRDSGSYSAGGADDGSGYKSWITAFAQGIGALPAIVIVEPDALAQLDTLPSEPERQTRLGLLHFAVQQLKSLAPQAQTYLDAGNSAWKPAGEIADRLNAAGAQEAHGFSLNVSNYRTTAESSDYGKQVSGQLQSKFGYGKPFVVDTSRNGNGPAGSQWADPEGRKIGEAPQVCPPGGGPEMKLWIKAPGEADGRVAPAGQFSPDLAANLVSGNSSPSAAAPPTAAAATTAPEHPRLKLSVVPKSGM